MRAAPGWIATTQVSDTLLYIGVALFAGGLMLFTGNLHSLDGSPLNVDAAGRSAGNALRDRSAHGSLASVGDHAVMPMAPGATNSGHPAPRSRRRERAVSANSLHDPNREVMERTAARWSAGWHRAVLVNGDGRGYLARSANWRRIARRSRDLMVRGNARGYQAVEAAQAARDETPRAAVS